MGAGVAAAHLVIFVAVASVGTLLVGAATDAMREGNVAQADAIHRLSQAANERITFLDGAFNDERCTNDNNPGTPGCQGGDPLPNRLYANFTNNGSHEIPLDKVAVLLDGAWTDTSTLDTFEIRGATTSELWMPGEVLEIMVQGTPDHDVAAVAPHGTKAYRRA